MISTIAQHTTRKPSQRMPIVPSKRMTQKETRHWRLDMAQTLSEFRKPSVESLLHYTARLNAPYCFDNLIDREKFAQRKIEQANPAPHGLSLSSDDNAIRSKAKTLSKRCEIACNRMMRDMSDDFAEKIAAQAAAKTAAQAAAVEKSIKDADLFIAKLAGVLFDIVDAVAVSGGSPSPRITGEDTQAVMAAVRRTWCEKWWRRRLNTDFKRWKEAKQIAAGKVARGRSAYVSLDALKDRAEQRERNKNLLKAFLAICDDEAVSLESCANASVSNPEIRRNEVMCRIRGLEEWADSVGYVSQFWTVTAPSRFHRFKTLSSGRLIDNKKWKGETPKDAQAYLVGNWALVRSKLAREGIDLVGFRVVEPHHDGCPHWHMLIFAMPENIERAAEIAREYALKDSPNESGAQKRRFLVERINRNINKATGKRNSAVGYIAKYISKNLDGKKGADNEPIGGNSHDGGGTINENIKKVDAWRSLWGVRQFQFFGAGAVSVWRELRRLKERPQGEISAVWETAQGELVLGEGARADWCAFLTQLEKNPITIMSALKVGDGTMMLYKNDYGEHVTQIVGLECAGIEYRTRLRAWTLIEASEAQRLGLVSISVRGDGTQDFNRVKHGGSEPPNRKKGVINDEKNNNEKGDSMAYFYV